MKGTRGSYGGWTKLSLALVWGFLCNAHADLSASTHTENQVQVYPERYRSFAPFFKDWAIRFADAQKSYLQNELRVDKESVVEFQIVESDIPNAKVVLNKDTSTTIHNKVEISTGLLRLLKSQSPDAPAFTTKLLGIIAHEMAHPIEHVDPQGIAKTHGNSKWRMYSQAMEIRADTEAIYLLRRLGVPESSLLQALDSILIYEAAPRGLWSGLSSHPENNLRKSMHRLALSYSRFEFGQKVQPQKMLPWDLVPDLVAPDYSSKKVLSDYLTKHNAAKPQSVNDDEIVALIKIFAEVQDIEAKDFDPALRKLLTDMAEVFCHQNFNVGRTGAI